MPPPKHLRNARNPALTIRTQSKRPSRYRKWPPNLPQMPPQGSSHPQCRPACPRSSTRPSPCIPSRLPPRMRKTLSSRPSPLPSSTGHPSHPLPPQRLPPLCSFRIQNQPQSSRMPRQVRLQPRSPASASCRHPQSCLPRPAASPRSPLSSAMLWRTGSPVIPEPSVSAPSPRSHAAGHHTVPVISCRSSKPRQPVSALP